MSLYRTTHIHIKNFHNANKIVSKYIEAVSGAKFSIRWKLSPSAFRGCDGIEGTVWIDGVLLTTRLHKAGKVDGEIQRIVLYYNADGSCTYQELRCSDLLTVEEPPQGAEGANSAQTVGKLGTIDVVLNRVRMLDSRQQFGTKKRGDELAASSFRPVPEKLLKGKSVSLRASLGPIKTDSNKRNTLITNHAEKKRITSKTKYAEDCPFAAFRFKYRSKDDLKKQYVIPRTPEPESDTEDVVIIGRLTPAIKIEVKQETDSGISKRCRTHDEESSSKRARTCACDSGDVDDDVLEIKTVTLTDKVVIDLTKDSDH